ncbi:MAG: diguanylate cyclase [Thermoleophilia bacterium]|nr:diguanylate cyclase [Thermoleophilia bacterium]
MAAETRGSVLVLAAAAIAVLAVVAIAIGGLRQIESQERSISDREDLHYELIQAQGELQASYAASALTVIGPPPGLELPPDGFPVSPAPRRAGSGTPSAPLPSSPGLPGATADLGSRLEQLRQISRQIIEGTDGAERRAAEQALASLRELQDLIGPLPDDELEIAEAFAQRAAAISRADGRLERLVSVQEQNISKERAGLLSIIRWYSIGLAALVLAVSLAVAVTWFALRRSRDRGLEELEASARRLADLAVTDPLTGLANQREFQLQLDAEVSRAQRYGRPLSLILLDLDHFKLVNDEFGHQTGDEVLTEAAARLRALARTGETMARIGGEEFAWIVPEAEQLDAYVAAERARKTVRRMPLGDVGWLTISCGVCDLRDAEDAAELIRHADSALYWAKDQGRDATFCFSPGAAQDLAERARAGGRERNQALGALRSLAQAIDSRHAGTRDHSRRVARVAEAVATELGWTPRGVARLRDAALVHDVGMVQVPDDVLLKSNALDETEQSLLREHVALGSSMVAEILEEEQAAWVRDHHERWDGSGYPSGLVGDEISAGGRILAIADAWDAMTHDRPHREARTADQALDELRGLSGTQFCPASVRALERAFHASKHSILAPEEMIVE